MGSKKLKILPLGGLGEVGMNCMVLEYGNDLVLIDCGIQFPDASYPGVDVLTPDLTYVRERLKNLRGILVTHGHEDHIGAIPFLSMDRDLDIYCSPFPRELIRHKMLEYPYTKDVRFHDVKPGRTYRIGCFEFQPIAVQHSIIEAMAFAIHTPVGTIVHTGDFKHDANEVGGERISFDPFYELGKKGVLLLLSDSTNAERTGHTLSENDIAKSFDEIFRHQKTRLLIGLFASNVRRIENMLWLAKEHHKKVAFAGRSMHTYTRLAHEQKSLDIPADTVILLDQTKRYRDDEVIVLLTGSQAEPRSALVRIAQGTHREFQLKSGDTVILSSRFIPGNERNITAMIDSVYRAGAEVIYESFYQIHVSGHGFQDELLMMLDATKPRFFVPIHGEYRHMAKHAKLAIQSGVKQKHIAVIEDGQAVEIDEHAIVLAEKHSLQKGVIVGGTFMEGDPGLFSYRNGMARTGIVYLTLLVDRRSRKLTGYPVITAHGILFRKGTDPGKVVEQAEDLVKRKYPDFADLKDWDEALKNEVRKFFAKSASHRPLVVATRLEI